MKNGIQIYFRYSVEIFIFSILICIIALFLGKAADKYFPKHDDKKSTLLLWAEILIQVSIIAVLTYFSREIIIWITSPIAPYYGNPMKYSIIIMAPIMFYQQVQLFEKMNEVMNRQFLNS
tara:strand:- start:751 stop:1110 length:360 start_codon:yes stop_codon:yes gene_type:complete